MIDHFLSTGQLEQAMLHTSAAAKSGTPDVGRLSRLMLVQELHGEFDEGWRRAAWHCVWGLTIGAFC